MECGPALVGGTNSHPVRVELRDKSIIFSLEDDDSLQKFEASHTYQNLPLQFKVIFENLEEIYRFVITEESKIRVDHKFVIISVAIIGKIKELQLPMEQIEPTGQLKLRRDIKTLQRELIDKNELIGVMSDDLKLRQETIQKLKKQLSIVCIAVHDRESDNIKLQNRIRHLENSIEDILNDKPKSTENNLNESRHTQEYTPVKKSSFASKSRKSKDLQEFGKKISFKIDQRSKHYNKFRITFTEVEKLHGPTYQLYHNEAIPKEGKYYFDIKIILIKNNNIVVGVITDKSKEEQFSFKKMNSVCYNGYDGSVCEQDKQSYVTVKPKEGNRLRTVVDISQCLIEWYIMGGQSAKTLIGRASIPGSMTKQPLYPYFQLYWQGNKVKLNA